MRPTEANVVRLLLCAYGVWLSVPASADEQNKVNWMLNCQGCHGASAVSIGADVPPLAQNVARFLSVPGGREYLIRVPGVAMASINDEAVAALTNWMLTEFDPDHIPSDFERYTATEVGLLRKSPFINQASSVRAELMRKIEKKELLSKDKKSTN